jgi:hypothetical protein
MGVRCPLCGLEHVGVERVMAAVTYMLRQVNDYEHKQPPIPVLLRPQLTVVKPSHAA